MEAGPDLTPPPGRLSPAPSPGGATAQKAGASPPPGPRTLDLVRLVRRGSASSAPTAEAWRPGLLDGGCGPIPCNETLTFSAGGCSASRPRGCSGSRDPPPKGGSGPADAAEHNSHSTHCLPELALCSSQGDLAVFSPCHSVDPLSHLSIQARPLHA